MKPFSSADILLPTDVSMEKWAVIACDQFTSQPEYWERVENYVGDAVSSLKLIFPEAKLGGESGEMVSNIRETMEKYMRENVFTEYRYQEPLSYYSALIRKFMEAVLRQFCSMSIHAISL